MKQYMEIRGRRCGAGGFVRNGLSENGAQRCRRNECGRNFQNECSCNAWKPGVTEQIEIPILNSSGAGDTGRNLGIPKNTVISGLKLGHAAERKAGAMLARRNGRRAG